MKNVAEEIKGLEIKTTAGGYIIDDVSFVSEYDQEQTYKITLGQKLGKDDVYPENFEGSSGEITVLWEGEQWDITYFGDVQNKPLNSGFSGLKD